ncbi:MAG: hypothetical protein KDA66_13735, partial [Planctomycetaceae bacterium]|nr:hypothetical protein [Planctomycetaceae bacterium]
ENRLVTDTFEKCDTTCRVLRQKQGLPTIGRDRWPIFALAVALMTAANSGTHLPKPICLLDRRLWTSGAGRKFLDSLPEVDYAEWG